MEEQLIQRFRRTQELFLDLIKNSSEKTLASKLDSLPSNTIGQQFWCVVGARRSYFNAAKAGKWEGFECPLDWKLTAHQNAIEHSLIQTSQELLDFLDEAVTLTDVQENYFLDLLEHEVQHQGQLIRYLYGLKLDIPSSWKSRYHLD